MGGSEMEKETSSLVSLGIVLIAIATVIAISFGIFSVGKRLANNGQNDLVSQVDQISQSTFTELNQQVIVGARLKGIVNQLSIGNYAILINTVALRNNQANSSNVTGDLADSIRNGGSAYSIVMTNYPSTSSTGTPIMSTAFVNYNALLENGCIPSTDAFDSGEQEQIGDLTTVPSKLGGVTSVPGADNDDMVCCGDKHYNANSIDLTTFKTLEMTDGVFETDLEFVTDSNTGRVAKNSRVADFNNPGTTMYVGDAEMFNSYCIKDSTGIYVGLAFVQIHETGHK